MSEDDQERTRHDQLVRHILNTPGRAIPLGRLFRLAKYPDDVMVLYAEGYSVSNFLVGQSNRSDFLSFVAMGMTGDWDGACKRYYNFRDVNDLEQAWLKNLRDSRPGQASAVLASRTQGDAPTTQRVVVRQTVPPAQPLSQLSRPTVRGQAPEENEAANPYPPEQSHATRPMAPPRMPGSGDPVAQPTYEMQSLSHNNIPPPPPVRLTAPQMESTPPVQLGGPVGGQR